MQTLTNEKIKLIVGTLLGDSAFTVDRRYNGKSYRLYFQHTNKEYVKFFKYRYNVKPSIYHDKRVKTYGYFLAFTTKDTLFLLNRLKDKQVKGVEYKFYFKTEGYIK